MWKKYSEPAKKNWVITVAFINIICEQYFKLVHTDTITKHELQKHQWMSVSWQDSEIVTWSLTLKWTRRFEPLDLHAVEHKNNYFMFNTEQNMVKKKPSYQLTFSRVLRVEWVADHFQRSTEKTNDTKWLELAEITYQTKKYNCW